MMENLCGKWQLLSIDNVKEYCEAIGASADDIVVVVKYVVPENNCTQELKFQDNTVTIVTSLPDSFLEVKGTLGQQFDTKFMDGRAIKCLFTFDDGKLKEEQTGAFTSTLNRFREGDNLIMTMTCGGVTSKRVYKKL